MKKIIAVFLAFSVSACASMFGDRCNSSVCYYEDPIMLKHPRAGEVVVCRPDRPQLLEDCAADYEARGFVRLREYPMYVPGAVRLGDKYYSSSY